MRTVNVVKVQMSSGCVHIQVQGHPTQCLERAHEIATACLGDRAWAFMQINFSSPVERELGWNRDSEWLMNCTAVYKPEVSQ